MQDSNPYAKYANPYAGYVPVGVPDPAKPLDLQSKRIGVQRDEAALALTPYQLAKQKADAAKAELDLKNAQEQYTAQHPKVSDSGLYGDAYLKTLSGSDRNMIKALSEGRLAFPQGSALRAPFWQEKLSQVSQYDPTFDATNFNTRAQARVNAVKGKLGQSNNALNTAVGHLGQLADQVSGTASHSFTPFNAVENTVSKTFGDPGVTNFQDTAAKLADELEAVYRNGGGAEQGVTRQLRSLDPNMSLAQKQGVIQNAMDLLASKMAANLSQYNFGTGGKPTWDMLDPHALQVLHDKAPGLLDKYFAPPPSSGGAGAPPQGPSGPDGPPPVTPTDYSGMTGGPSAELAQSDPNSNLGAFKQTYRNEYDPVMANALSTFIRHGAPFETAAAFAQSHGFNPPQPDAYAQAVAFAKAHGGAVNVDANRSVPTTLGERLASSPLAAGLASAASAGTAGLLDTAGRTIAGPAFDANRAALAQTNPGADLAGNVIGGAGAMIGGGSGLARLAANGAKGGLGRNALAFALRNPVKAGAIGDTLYGGAYGANETPDNPLGGAAIGAAGGMFGGLAGSGVAKGVGGVLHGVVNPAAQRLRAAGIPLSAGEVLGGGFKKAQDAMTSVFGPGNMVSRRYADGREALNRAAFNEAGQIVGAPINDVGQAGIQALDAAKNRAYSTALDPVQVNLDTPQTISGIVGAARAAKAIPNVDQASDLASGALENYIQNAAPDGNMSGADFQQAYRGLARTAKQAGSRVYGHEIGQALGKGQDALVGALQDQNPGAYEAFLKANSANRHLSVLSNAVNAAKSQIGDNGEPLFTPAQLGTAATANARTYNGAVAAASGQRPFNQLANDAQQVMSSKLPESGTFPRQLMGMAVTGGAGGMFGGSQNGYQGAAEGAAVPLGLLTLLGTRRGQQLLSAALLNRTVGMRAAGHALDRKAPLAGSLITAADVPFLTGQ